MFSLAIDGVGNSNRASKALVGVSDQVLCQPLNINSTASNQRLQCTKIMYSMKKDTVEIGVYRTARAAHLLVQYLTPGVINIYTVLG